MSAECGITPAATPKPEARSLKPEGNPQSAIPNPQSDDPLLAAERRKSEAEHRREMVQVCRLMYEQGLIVATDGNVSVRVGDEHFLITPSGTPKGLIDADAMILCRLDGGPTDPARRPSSEVSMHVACYQARPDVRAVVHAHPPTATAFTLARAPLDLCVIPEVVLQFGGVPTLPYATPTTYEVPDSIRAAIAGCDALMLETHGSVTVGPTLLSAYLKLESLEHAANILHRAQALGPVRQLSRAEVEKLLAQRARLGLRGPIAACRTGGRR